MTIEEFIRARLDEDEDIAAGARPGPRRDWAEDYGREFVVLSRVTDGLPVYDVRSTVESQHIARHDPARVLRRVAALRKAVEAAGEIGFQAGDPQASQGYADMILRPLASAWSDHPDYQEEWKL